MSGRQAQLETGVLVTPDGDHYRFSALVGGGFSRTLQHIGRHLYHPQFFWTSNGSATTEEKADWEALEIAGALSRQLLGHPLLRVMESNLLGRRLALKVLNFVTWYFFRRHSEFSYHTGRR
jgi:hypothetical protein